MTEEQYKSLSARVWFIHAVAGLYLGAFIGRVIIGVVG